MAWYGINPNVPPPPTPRDVATVAKELTPEWRLYKDVRLYLERCQHDTPANIVKRVWRFVNKCRPGIAIRKVVDFGAGDGRFARHGRYESYVGFEIDRRRQRDSALPKGARIVHKCAFASNISDACVAVGNPPFVRNQDLPGKWREEAASVIAARTGVSISGLANAWQYFALLSLASTKADGLVALVMPYEWVSRPSSNALRKYVIDYKWGVDVYRLRDETFNHVLTTSSITIIDKSITRGTWRYFVQRPDGQFQKVTSPTGAGRGVIRYTRPSRARDNDGRVYAQRGLSPGTQEVLTLTEMERVSSGLEIDRDVVRCVTSLRRVSDRCKTLTESVFNRQYKNAGAKCWLIRTGDAPSARLRKYLDGVPAKKRQTSTCEQREEWWRFTMPTPPDVVVASGFNGARPKAVRNAAGVVVVGSVSGIYGLRAAAAKRLVDKLHAARFRSGIVAHSNGLRKVEVGQLQTFVDRHTKLLGARSRAS